MKPPERIDPMAPRFHVSRSTTVTLAPGTVTVRLANVPEAEWQWLQQLLESRKWKAYQLTILVITRASYLSRMSFFPLTPPLFHVGQAVVCIDPTIQHETSAGITMHLDMSTVYTIEVVKRKWGKWFVQLNVWREFVFEEIHFAPAELLPDEAVAALVAESLEAVPA